MTISDDWKSSLGKFFADNGTYRVDYLKNKIENDMKEYISFLQSFHKIRVERKSFEEIEDTVYKTVFKIQLGNTFDGRIKAFPFILGLNVSKECNLEIVTSKALLPDAKIKNLLMAENALRRNGYFKSSISV